MATDNKLRLQGKVAIVTGAASGFGLGITKLFASHGARVIAGDLNEDALTKAFSPSAAQIVPVTANATVAEDWKKLLDTATSKFGCLDIIVNNAGTSYKNKPTLDVTEDEFARCFDVNVRSVFHSVQVCVPQMIKQGKGGSIINIESISATRPRPGLVWYAASKGAVHTATRGLAAEYGSHNIRVNGIAPLLTGTGLFEMFAGVPDTPENRQNFLSNVPLGRLGEVGDTANVALFLASDEAKFITGTTIDVDGGRAV